MVGVVTLTGVGFLLGFVVVQTATDMGSVIGNTWPFSFASVAHFFVFYYGVLADITPPVASAAYAAAGIAGSKPFQTGNTAFCLGIAKALAPFVFVYSPSLLLVADGFTWSAFVVTLGGRYWALPALVSHFPDI